MKHKNSTFKQVRTGKLILLLVLSGALNACSSRQPRPLYVAPALREIFRGGELKGLENNEGQFVGDPGQFNLVEHTCVSSPIFDIYGQYVKTSVRCW